MKRFLRMVLLNFIAVILYWGIAHLNWLIFSSLGVLPMPVWPSAAIAILMFFYFGWGVFPGIVLGVIFSNHFSLGASWLLSALISVMNTLGPLAGAYLIRKIAGLKLKITSFSILQNVLLVSLVMVPALTAFGGIGFKWILGLTPSEAFLGQYFRWFMAHSIGTLLLAPVILLILKGRAFDAE